MRDDRLARPAAGAPHGPTRAATAAARLGRDADAPPGQRPGPRGRRVRHRHGLDRDRPVRPGVAAAARGRADRRAAPDDRGDAPDRRSATPASRGSSEPWRFTIAGHPSVSGPRRRRADGRARWTRARIGPARVPARPRAAGGRDLVPAVAPARRGPRAVDRPGHRGPRARRDRPDAGAARGAPGRRHRGGPRHRAVRSSGRPAAGASTRRSSSRSPTTLDATARLATSLADERRPLLRELGARAARAAGRCASTLGAELRPGRGAARHRVAAARRPARGGPGRLRPAAAAARLARRLGARQRRSRSRSSRCATAATSSRSRPRPGRGSRASSTTRRGAARRCSSSRSSRSSSATPGARRRSPSARRSPGSSTSCRRSSPPTRTALRETLEALARFDLWAAKADARRRDGRASGPRRPTGPRSILLSARHPGLTGRVVPIDIRLGDGYTALVVTGPNTGGKTVTLRTLGLLSLMHQAGLHVPAAAGSRLPVWRDVFADIGDEQSIAQSLSTFSGHLRSIIRIVEAAGPGTLVLLDELGRGHGPDRGLGAGPGAPRPLHPGRRARRGDDPLRRAQGLRPHHARGAQRGGRVRPRHAVADLPADDRAAGRQPGVRHRRAAGAPAGRSSTDARSRLTEAQRTFEATLASIKATEGETSEALDRARAAELRAAEALRVAEEERRRARRERDERGPGRPGRGGADRGRPARRGGRDPPRRSSARP